MSIDCLKLLYETVQRALPSRLLTVVGRFWAVTCIALISSTSLAGIRCEELFNFPLAVSQNETLAGVRHLLAKDPRLHLTPMVEKAAQRQGRLTGVTLQKPAAKVQAWIKYLETTSVKAQKNTRLRQVLNESFYNQFVIKPDQVPSSYFAFQARLARERGHGEVTLTAEQKQQLIDTLIVDQKRSLDLWVDYMLSPDSAMYPMWAKYWILTGMAKLSKFNPETGTFGNRSHETVAPFPELNREALAYAVDALIKHVEGRDLLNIQDAKLINLLTNAQFGKMYAHALVKAGVGDSKQFVTNEGHWVLYKQGTDHLPLVKSLEGRNTGWCTAGESTAQSQLSRGDFYVYYSRDTDGNYSIPRVALRMEGNRIGEVRGVAEGQNIDKLMNESNIVTNKLKEFGSEADKYLEKESHMKKLTEMDHKNKLGQLFSRDEILFLYEVNGPINGFGHGADPRIKELKLSRDTKSDIAVILEGKYRKEEISLTDEEAMSGKFKVHYGDLYLNSQTSLSGVNLPEVVLGRLSINRITSAEGLRLPKIVQGGVSLLELNTAQGLILPKNIGGPLGLASLTSAQGLKFPEVTGDIHLGALKMGEGLQLPRIVKGSLALYSLSSAVGLKLPETVQGALNLSGLKSAKGLVLPKNISGPLNLFGLTSAQGLMLPKTIHGTLNLNRLESPEGLILPEAVHGDVIMYNLKSGKGLKAPIGANVRANVKLEYP